MHKGKDNAIEYSSFAIQEHKERLIKDIDTKQGIITGYFSIFGNVDSDGDMIMPGAFKKTVSESNGRIKHLLHHTPSLLLSSTRSGRLTVKEDNNGLYFESQISKTSWGKDAIILYEDGVIDEHSIGFNTVREQKARGYNEILEVKLFEGSTVAWGANELALVQSVKSLTKEDAFERMNKAIKAFRNGKYENEEIFDLLEIHIKQLQQYIIDLSQPISTQAVEATSPVVEVTPEPQPEAVKELKGEELLLLSASIENLNLQLKTWN